MLVLFPHLTCDSILPLISSGCLTQCHCTHSQFTYSIEKRTLEVRQFVIVVVIVVVIIIIVVVRRLNIPRAVLPDEVVKRYECRWNEGLDIHVICRRIAKHSKMPLDNPKDPLNNIASLRVMQIEQLLGVLWTRRNVSEI